MAKSFPLTPTGDNSAPLGASFGGPQRPHCGGEEPRLQDPACRCCVRCSWWRHCACCSLARGQRASRSAFRRRRRGSRAATCRLAAPLETGLSRPERHAPRPIDLCRAVHPRRAAQHGAVRFYYHLMLLHRLCLPASAWGCSTSCCEMFSVTRLASRCSSTASALSSAAASNSLRVSPVVSITLFLD